jgi:hypothetical protein
MKARIPQAPNPHTKKQRYKDTNIDNVKILIGVTPKNEYGLFIVLLDLRPIMD